MGVIHKLKRLAGLAARPGDIALEVRRRNGLRVGKEFANAASSTDARKFSSQNGQDRYLADVVFPGKRNGVFVEIGANDGVAFSNSLFFEQQLDWTGVCIEPQPASFAKLITTRKTKCVNCCVGAEGGTVPFLQIDGYANMLSGMVDSLSPDRMARIDREIAEFGGSKRTVSIAVRTLHAILAEAGVSSVDFISIDTEGAELPILKSIDFGKTFPRAICVENNEPDPYAIQRLMRDRGFELVCILGDEIYLNRKAG